MRQAYTDKQVAFLRKKYMAMNVGQLTAAFNEAFGEQKTESAIHAALGNNRIRCGRKQGERIRSRKYIKYTDEQAEFIAKNYKGWSLAELTEMFNEKFGEEKTVRQIKTFVHNRGIVSGRTGYFEKGHAPHNKGKKGWDAGGNSKKTRFRKGNRPQTWVPVGSKRIAKGGILQTKISDTGYMPRDWKSDHSLLWEKHHGRIPAGHIVVFKNQGEKKIRIENLECISRAENMRRNTIHNLPGQLKDVIRIRGVLNRHINRIQKG